MAGVRKPRAVLVVEGARLALIEWEAEVSRHQKADTFSACMAVNALPPGFGLSYWADVGAAPCSLMACNDAADGWVTLVKGWLDQASVEIGHEGLNVRVSGRDRAGELLDTRETKKRSNRKSSDIVQEIASEHGFEADVDATDDYAGKEHVYENTHLTDIDTKFEVIARLAEREGAFFFIKGDTLYFKLPGNDGGQFGTYRVTCVPPAPGRVAQGNFTHIRFGNNCHLSGTLKSTVRSAHTRKKKNVTDTEELTRSAGEAIGLEWIDHFPGLTDAQVSKIARKKSEERGRHQVTVEVEMPGDVNIDPRMMLQVTGTGSSFDQQYYIDSIGHRGSFRDGYHMSVRAKNKKGGS